jgi:hypothetical protein
MVPLSEQPRDVGRSAVQESGCEKAYHIGKEKRAWDDWFGRRRDGRSHAIAHP